MTFILTCSPVTGETYFPNPCHSCPHSVFWFPPFTRSSQRNQFSLLPHLYGSLLPLLSVRSELHCRAYSRLAALAAAVTAGTYRKGNAETIKPTAWWSEHGQSKHLPQHCRQYSLLVSHISRSRQFVTFHFRCGNTSLNICMVHFSYFFFFLVPRCVICMMDFVYGDPIRFLPCMHIYHLDCIDDWLMRSFTCPSCMEPVDAALLSSYETNWARVSPPNLQDHPRQWVWSFCRSAQRARN